MKIQIKKKQKNVHVDEFCLSAYQRQNKNTTLDKIIKLNTELLIAHNTLLCRKQIYCTLCRAIYSTLNCTHVTCGDALHAALLPNHNVAPSKSLKY